MSISIFFNLFGSQSRVSNSNAEEMVDVSSSIEPRYPKRKRAQVKYNEIDGQEFLLDGEIEEEYEPKTKVCC
jgi:hypothetical protein